jgi:hypothetical protein
VQAGTVCRQAASGDLCDVAEACDGSAQCPADDHLPDGAACNGNRGTCSLDTCCPGVTQASAQGGLCSLGTGKDIVFVSSFDVDGAVTQAGADKLCLDAARSANLAGRFDAWLSYVQPAPPQSQVQINAVDRLRDPILPAATTSLNLVNGTLIANSLDLLVQQQGIGSGMVYSNGISRTEWNDPRPGPNGVPGAIVYTGTTRTGTLAFSPVGAVPIPLACANWTNDTGQVSAETGISNTGKPDWTEHATNTCDNNTYALYCFSAPQPIVFVTSQPTFLGDGLGSIASADGFCNQLAARGNLPGKYFHAWISDSTVDARKRIPNRAYFLRNGKRVAQSIADLIDGTIDNPINIDETGATPTGTTMVWTGTNSAGMASGDCSDWTPSTALDGTQGTMDKNTAAWTDASLVTCRGSARLYCFQIN